MALQTSTPVVQDPRLVELGINVIRGIAMDAPEQANSGHSGTAMALAPLAHVLWTRIMHYDPRDPEWPDRDRFVLSNGHACILQYAMLHLTGYDLSLEDLRQFRQWGSRTPGHPEAGHTAGIDVTTGPLGQGVGNAVGMAIAERWLRTTFGSEVCDHRTYVIAGDGCFMEGISHEAASLAGHLGLGRLLAFYDDNHITIDGPTELAYNDNVARALRGLRLARAQPRRDGQRRRRAGGRHPRGARRAGGRTRRQADPPGAAQPHRLALAEADRHRGGPRLALRRRGDQGDQGAPRPADRPDLLGPRRGARLLRPADRPRRRAPRGVDRALRRLGGRPRRLGRRAGRARAAGLGRRPARLRGRHQAGHPPRHQPVHRRHRGQAARPAGRLGRPDRQQRREGQGRRDAVAPDPRRDPGPLRDPRARHGGGHERHGAAPGRAAARRDVLLLLRLHAPVRPPGRADGHPRHLFVDPRLHRPGRGRPDAPADRAPGLAAGHARPQPRPPGRRQRDGAGLAHRRRGRRAGRPGADPPGRPRAGRHGRAGGRGRAQGRLRPGRQRRAAPDRPGRHRERGPALRGRRRDPGRVGRAGPGGVVPVLGPLRAAARRLPGHGVPARGAGAEHRGRRHLRLGPLRRRLHRDRPLRRVGPGRGRHGEVRFHRRPRGRAGPGPAGRHGLADSRPAARRAPHATKGADR